MSTTMKKGLPHFAQGEVIKGFGRGSKDLGCPTANFPEDVVANLPADLEAGVYFGFASVDDGPVHKMVMNLGWNPFYNNEKKSMETHIMHKFDEDFYGKQLKVAVLGYMRGEKNFDSLQGLIAAINEDIRMAGEKLDEEQYAQYKNDAFFNV